MRQIASEIMTVSGARKSVLNSISVAIAHDILKPLRKTFLSDRAELFVARSSTVFVGILIALCTIGFRDIFLGLLGSMNIWLPFFFAPLFLGILGIQRNKQDFWFGACAAAIVWLIGTKLTSFATAWVVLAATGANLFTISGRHLHQRWTVSKPASMLAKPQASVLEQKEPEYALFATLTLASAMLPFFFWSYHGEEIDGATFSVYLISALLCLSLLFKDFFSWISKPYWSYLWYLVSLFCLPFISSFAVVQSHFSPFWILDFILVGFLLWLFVGRQVYWSILATGILTGTLFASLHTQNCHLNINSFWLPQISFLLHVLSLGAYFVVFRHRAAEEVVSAQAYGDNMAHAIQTVLAEFSIEAKTLRRTMPVLLNSYQTAIQSNPEIGEISRKRLEFLESIPDKMQRNTVRLKTNVDMMLGKMGFANGVSAVEIVSVQQSISAALSVFQRPVEWMPAGKISFLGNIDLFELALLELLKNASESIQAASRGEISIKLDEVTRELWVEDSAGGVPVDHLGKIFERRFTTKPTGTGLGLYFCKLVLNDWGGDIRCVSEEGAWTRFIISLPEMKKEQELSA